MAGNQWRAGVGGPPTCYFSAIGDNLPMRKRKKEYSYQINLIPNEEGGYTAVVPLLPGCISYGGTIEEATANVREAIQLHLENLAAHDEPIPAVA
jgi:antitoxin HicB